MIRGISFLTGYLIRHVDDTTCQLTYVAQSDPRGGWMLVLLSGRSWLSTSYGITCPGLGFDLWPRQERECSLTISLFHVLTVCVCHAFVCILRAKTKDDCKHQRSHVGLSRASAGWGQGYRYIPWYLASSCTVNWYCSFVIFVICSRGLHTSHMSYTHIFNFMCMTAFLNFHTINAAILHLRGYTLIF